MILAHLADLHLGFRAYPRAAQGHNVREGDVCDAFLRAVDELTRLGPDAVLIAGDVFDQPDPPPRALVTLTQGIRNLRDALPSTPVLIAAGPRDMPVQMGDRCVLSALDAIPGVTAAAGTPRAVRVGDTNAVLLPPRASSAVTGTAGGTEPDPSARWNVLVTHALAGSAASTARQHASRWPRSARDRVDDPVSPDRAPLRTVIDPGMWDYVALGGEHVQRTVRSHVRWAGSLERVGWRPWNEALEEKGFLTYDLTRKRARFHPVCVRAVVSLAPIRVLPGQSDRLHLRMREVTDEVPGGIDQKIVLLRVRGADPLDLAGLVQRLVSALRQRALHLSVVLEDVDVRTPAALPGGPLYPRLAELLVEEGVPSDKALGLAGALLGEMPTEAETP